MMEMATSTVAAVQGIFQSTHHLHAKWHRISAPPLPRSSHTLSVVNGRAYIFGGEVNPGEPVDNSMHVIILPSDTVMEADYKTMPAKTSRTTDVEEAVPEKRIGHTAAIIGERIFVFGGRGQDTKPLEEKGRVWVFDTKTDTWIFLDPSPGTEYPSARSDHASVSFDKPEPSQPVESRAHPLTGKVIPGSVAANLKSVEEADYGTLFIHAGRSKSGLTNDLWGFDIRSQTWKEYPSAPGQPRGGTSLAVSKSRIYRYGGFGSPGSECQEEGQVDFLELELETFADFSGEGQGGVALASRRDHWDTLLHKSDKKRAEQGGERGNRRVPGNRSVAGLQTIMMGMGREYLMLLLGEKDLSDSDGDGAQRFLGDVWAFQVPPHGMTGASVTDATRQAMGRETGENLWSEVFVADAEGSEGEDVRSLTPGERGWFASSNMGDLDAGGIVIWGGLKRRNINREGDGWILRIH